MEKKITEINRKTNETDINLSLSIVSGESTCETGIAFFDHMLDQIAKHGGLSMQLTCKGDLDIDAHHTVEDVGIVLGEAISQAIGDKKGIYRFANAYAPLDESLARTVIDFSGRPGLFFRANFTRSSVGEFDVQLVREFFQGFTNGAKATIHIDLLEGENTHHQIEAIFKSFALALRRAIEIRPNDEDIPSTKGSL